MLVRLINLESATLGYTAYRAGQNIQTSRVLVFLNGKVYHADATNINHAGNVVGLAIESASTDEYVKVHAGGPYIGPLAIYPEDGYGYVGTNGLVVAAPSLDYTFIQGVGMVTSPYAIVFDLAGITLL